VSGVARLAQDPRKPPSAASLQAEVDAQGAVPLSWVATTPEAPDANLGDALSPIIVSAISGLPVRHCNFDADCERLVGIGTIAHSQKKGRVHFWGTGLDDRTIQKTPGGYVRPQGVEPVAHAMRGPNSANALRRSGLKVPAVYGDPVWFLPRIVPVPDVEKRYELGVVMHISEAASPSAEAPAKRSYLSYRVPPRLRSKIRIINTYARPTPQALFDKVDEIRACRRIVSSSFHGLVIAETFGIPNLWFAKYAGGAMSGNIDDPTVRIDHRVRDFYAGLGIAKLAFYAGAPRERTDWSGVMSAIDENWTSVAHDARDLFDAFPLRKAVSFEERRWPLDRGVLDSIKF